MLIFLFGSMIFSLFFSLILAMWCRPIWTIPKDFFDLWFLDGFSKGGRKHRRSKEKKDRVGDHFLLAPSLKGCLGLATDVGSDLNSCLSSPLDMASLLYLGTAPSPFLFSSRNDGNSMVTISCVLVVSLLHHLLTICVLLGHLLKHRCIDSEDFSVNQKCTKWCSKHEAIFCYLICFLHKGEGDVFASTNAIVLEIFLTKEQKLDEVYLPSEVLS